MEIKPTSLKAGMPPAQTNGLYGLEEVMIADPSSQVFAVVTYGVDEVVEKHLADEKYPVVKVLHIEPLRDARAIESARKLLQAAYKKRTGEGALPLPELDGSEPDGDES